MIDFEKSDVVRLMANTKVRKETDCWEWQGNTDARGYGIISVNGKNIKAHRFMCFLATRGLDEVVMHHCDNPPCVNPNHLSAAKTVDNVRDAFSKGRKRGMQGMKHPMRKINENDVREIRRKASLGFTRLKIAIQYGMSRQQIDRIVRREMWRNV